LYKKWRQLSSIGAIWLVCDLDWTNFYKIYGRFEEIGLLEVEAVFICLQYFGLDVLLGIDEKMYSFIYDFTINCNLIILIYLK
jgi:hypothetical protein